VAGKYGSPSLAITYDDGPGGTSRTVTPFILSIGGIKVEAITEQSNPFGTGNEAHTPTGMVRTPDIEVEGHYDTTATTGPHVVFGTPDDGPQDSTRTFTFAPGDSKTFTMETRLVSYEVIGQNGNLTRFKAVIRQAGLGAWT
jgi:hypothetical protein